MSAEPIRVVAGYCAPEHFATPSSIANMAIALCEHARGRGLVVVRMLSSRVRGSATKHLQLRDGRSRHWLIRISDHRAPKGTGYDLPHFDLVSFDGDSGYDQAVAFVDSIGAGEARWHPPVRDRQRRGHHVRGQKTKPGGCR
ncbi:MAG TPA: hypothetical protein VEC11_07620 [Allosphingosinicella sp.]|nr:hypothetical protein [Allosphingosinicella sp.]